MDVGAHRGAYTDLFLKYFKNLKAYLFEPQKKIFNFIKKKHQHSKNIKCFNIAISNKNSSKVLFINEHGLTSSLSVLNSKNKYLKYKAILFGRKLKGMIKDEIIVKTATLNQIIIKNKLPNIDLLKIDTEGHELEVLLGIGKNIKKIKYILVEIHNDTIYKNYNPKKIHNFLIKNNFSLKRTFKFPFTTWEDRIYSNKTKNEHSRASS